MINIICVCIIVAFVYFFYFKKETFTSEIVTIEPTNYNKMILKDAINKINTESVNIVLENSKYFTVYRPGTFSSSLIELVKKMVTPYINKINILTETCNVLNGIDNILLENFDSTKRYTIDFFIYYTSKYVKTRIICIFLLKNNDVKLSNINLGNSKYINKTYIKENNNYIGDFKPSLLESSLEKSSLTGKKKNPDGRQSDDENSWIQHKDVELLEQKCIDVFPSRKVKHNWTVEGIQYTEFSNNPEMIGINSSENRRRVIGSFNPTIATLPSDNLGLRGGLFNLGEIMPGFPTSGGSSSF